MAREGDGDIEQAGRGYHTSGEWSNLKGAGAFALPKFRGTVGQMVFDWYSGGLGK